jgi:hypothetical protein
MIWVQMPNEISSGQALLASYTEKRFVYENPSPPVPAHRSGSDSQRFVLRHCRAVIICDMRDHE